MKWSAVALLFAATIAWGGSAKDLDAKNGFRDLPFGISVESVPGLQPAGKDGVLDLYRRPEDKLEIGVVPLEAITYRFFQGRLYQVFIEVAGIDNGMKLVDALAAQYGKPKPAPVTPDELIWGGAKHVGLWIKFDREKDRAMVTFNSKDMSSEVGDAERAAAKSAKSDL